MGWIPYPTALSGNAGTPQASAPQQAMGRPQAQMSHPQLLGQLLRGGGQGMAAQPQPQAAQQMAQSPAGQGADPFAAARAAVAQHTGQPATMLPPFLHPQNLGERFYAGRYEAARKEIAPLLVSKGGPEIDALTAALMRVQAGQAAPAPIKTDALVRALAGANQRGRQLVEQ